MNNIEGPRFPRDSNPTIPKSDAHPTNPTSKKIQSQSKKISQPRANEAEDLHQRVHRPRSSSVSRVKPGSASGIEADKIEVAKRSGVLWDCISRKPNKEGGYIYKFRLKDKYDDVTTQDPKRSRAAQMKNDQIFPAVEFTSKEAVQYVANLDKNKFIDDMVHKEVENIFNQNPIYKLVGGNFKEEMRDMVRMEMLPGLEKSWMIIQTFAELGYKANSQSTGVYFECPDREALIGRWEKLREEQPNLPKLDIGASEGVADDMSFVESYLTYDALLSSGVEFLHDQTQHVMAALHMILTSDEDAREYETERIRLIGLVGKIYSRIKLVEAALPNESDGKLSLAKDKLNELKVLLGALADSMSNIPTTEMTRSMFDPLAMDLIIHTLTITPSWMRYFDKRDFKGAAGLIRDAYSSLEAIERETKKN
jgi:hypothetical protein